MNVDKDYQQARTDFQTWRQQLQENILRPNSSLMHTYQCYFSQQPDFMQQLSRFALQVAEQLEPLVVENNLDANLPKIEQYNAIGERHDRVIHHPSYVAAGDLIYGSGLMRYLLTAGQMQKTLSLFLLSAHAGEAGHNCPIACSAGVIRILSHYSQLKQTKYYLDKLTEPAFSQNYTGAQFLTEIQGGSDVGANAAYAYQDNEGQWRISGEKWFCSNANADLILLTARYDQQVSGTRGLGLFLLPSQLSDGKPNQFKLRRLKQKIGTRSMATAEIDFEAAFAYPMGEMAQGINLVMENVLHLSRIFNAFSVLGMARRAYQIAYYYAVNRAAFQHKIIKYPLVKETLAHIKAENTALLASIFHMVHLQDELDANPQQEHAKTQQLLLRTLANINKYYTAKRTVENVHHCLDILAGNGTIESFSSLPRLLRDCIVCENWEGTHFTLWMQTLRDINKFQVDELFLAHLLQLLNQVKESSQHKLTLQENIVVLAEKIKVMKRVSAEEQSLQIQEIIEKMAILHAALTLVLELQVGNPPEAKKGALDLFMQKHINKNGYPYTDYIGLLNAILAIN
ncbi:Acyl-CoA dehydrogenase [Legionella donaldsonii]|uniref:Acyl-CoA dehydrogenase n=1 Tax=Legionella donaldsonii TaxID=45060 RepID=A0A378J382_9GAMM|nr:acyl-CoA dehydrogenase family protein [Legionella donaldsonii]STX41387.1 Acyl-CoA dehydrogenase [Legionella donaldsonii]